MASPSGLFIRQHRLRGQRTWPILPILSAGEASKGTLQRRCIPLTVCLHCGKQDSKEIGDDDKHGPEGDVQVYEEEGEKLAKSSAFKMKQANKKVKAAEQAAGEFSFRLCQLFPVRLAV